MTETKGNETVLLSGRDFSAEDFWVITETVRRFPKLSRTELANTICENIQWVAPNGRNKVVSCAQLLERLNAEGKIRLPKKQTAVVHRPRKVTPIALDPPADITDYVNAVGVRIKPVLGTHEMRLWNQYVERYHSLGYKIPFGAHQRYFILAYDERIPESMLFSASAWALSALPRPPRRYQHHRCVAAQAEKILRRTCSF